MIYTVNPEKFLADVTSAYQHPRVEITRLADDVITKNELSASGLLLSTTRFAPTDGLFTTEHFTLELSNGYRLIDAPRTFYDTGNLARMVWMRMEKMAQDQNITRPMGPGGKDCVLGMLKKSTAMVHYKRTTNPGQRMFTDTFKIKLRGVLIHGIVEYNLYTNTMFEYVTIRNPYNTMPLPRFYNSFNSNDTAFAALVITELKNHVR